MNKMDTVMSYERAKALLGSSIARPTLYRVNLGSRIQRSTNDYLDMFCNRATIPSRRLNTTINLGHENIGVARELPNTLVHAKPLSLSVIEPRDFSVYADITRWFDGITMNSNVAGQNLHMNYANTYSSDISIEKLESPALISDTNPIDPYVVTARWTFHDAYPITVGEINLESDNVDALLNWNVEFTYTTYTSQATGVGATVPGFLTDLFTGV